MTRAFPFILMVAAIGFWLLAAILVEHTAPNAGLPLVRNARDTIDDSWPPTRFQADATALVHFVAPRRIEAACGVRHDPVNVEEACELGDLVVLPNPCGFPRGESFARLACHELAHVNNWPGNHPR